MSNGPAFPVKMVDTTLRSSNGQHLSQQTKRSRTTDRAHSLQYNGHDVSHFLNRSSQQSLFPHTTLLQRPTNGSHMSGTSRGMPHKSSARVAAICVPPYYQLILNTRRTVVPCYFLLFFKLNRTVAFGQASSVSSTNLLMFCPHFYHHWSRCRNNTIYKLNITQYL